MADNTQKKPDEGDNQSMEEILQSIKRIIAEEEDGSEPMKQAAIMTEEKPYVSGSDVLELTEAVQADGTVVDLRKSAASSGRTSEIPAFDALLSQETASATSAALRNLADRATPKASIMTSPSPAFRSGNTVEDLVIETLRPMLKDWLDANLQHIVERVVEREVRRLTSNI